MQQSLTSWRLMGDFVFVASPLGSMAEVNIRTWCAGGCPHRLEAAASLASLRGQDCRAAGNIGLAVAGEQADDNAHPRGVCARRCPQRPRRSPRKRENSARWCWPLMKNWRLRFPTTKQSAVAGIFLAKGCCGAFEHTVIAGDQ